MKMWEPSCSSTSSPRFVLTWIPTWFVIVPEGAYSAASLPSRSATYSSSRFTVGSSPNTSAPAVASSIARRIPSVGRVTVSLRRSIIGCLHHSVRPSQAPDAWWRSGFSPPPPDRLPRVPRPPADRPPQHASLRVAIRTLFAPRVARSPRVAAPVLLSTQQPLPHRPQPACVPPAAHRQARTARDRSGRIRQTRPPPLLQPRPQVYA